MILASQSPRRAQILRDAGFEFEVIARDVNEYAPDDLHPRAVAVLISENKAKAYNDLASKHVVITADTIVGLKNQRLEKPTNADEAFDMLKQLSGTHHLVVTGVTIFHKGKFRSFSEETRVKFRTLDDAEIRYYVEKYEPFDKAGGYGIQEWLGLIGVSHIEGDYYNVMGLPMCRLYQELHAFC